MKIFVQQQDSKFINNLVLSLRHMNLDVLSTDIQDDLYRIYHHHRFDLAVFVASKINREVAQFISEMFSSKHINFVIYHDTTNKEIIQDFGKVAKHLTHQSCEDTITIPSLINTHIYKNLGLFRKRSSYAVFLDHAKNIPDNLLDILYPNTKLHLHMFNSIYVSHPQNLGKVSEIDKASILNTYEFLIDINNDYAAEAVACGAKPITIEQIKKGKKPKIVKADSNNITYETFIRSNLL